MNDSKNKQLIEEYRQLQSCIDELVKEAESNKTEYTVVLKFKIRPTAFKDPEDKRSLVTKNIDDLNFRLKLAQVISKHLENGNDDFYIDYDILASYITNISDG